MKVIIKTKRGRLVAAYACTNPRILQLDKELRRIYRGYSITYVLES